jgi:uncharacterized protein YjbJ (UPF0337 family)
MNQYQAKGLLIYTVGKIEETAGKLLRNSRRQVKGYQRKITGQAIMAIGDAQKALKLCISAKIPEMDNLLEKPSAPKRLTSKT